MKYTCWCGCTINKGNQCCAVGHRVYEDDGVTPLSVQTGVPMIKPVKEKPITLTRLKEFLGSLYFALRHLFDRSVYRCVWCTKVRSGAAARIYPGYACSNDCYKKQTLWLFDSGNYRKRTTQ